MLLIALVLPMNDSISLAMDSTEALTWSISPCSSRMLCPLLSALSRLVLVSTRTSSLVSAIEATLTVSCSTAAATDDAESACELELSATCCAVDASWLLATVSSSAPS